MRERSINRITTKGLSRTSIVKYSFPIYSKFLKELTVYVRRIRNLDVRVIRLLRKLKFFVTRIACIWYFLFFYENEIDWGT